MNDLKILLFLTNSKISKSNSVQCASHSLKIITGNKRAYLLSYEAITMSPVPRQKERSLYVITSAVTTLYVNITKTYESMEYYLIH